MLHNIADIVDFHVCVWSFFLFIIIIYKVKNISCPLTGHLAKYHKMKTQTLYLDYFS